MELLKVVADVVGNLGFPITITLLLFYIHIKEIRRLATSIEQQTQQLTRISLIIEKCKKGGQ